MGRSIKRKALDKQTRGPLKKPKNRGEVKKYQKRSKRTFWALRTTYELSKYFRRAATRREAAQKFQAELAPKKKKKKKGVPEKQKEPEWVHKRRGKKYLVLYQGQQGRKYKVGDKVSFYQLKGMIKQQLGRADIGIRQRLGKTTRLRPVVAYVNKRRADRLFGNRREKAVKEAAKQAKKLKKQREKKKKLEKQEEEWQAFLAQAERGDEEDSSDSEEEGDEAGDESSEESSDKSSDESEVDIRQFKDECVAGPLDKKLWLKYRNDSPMNLHTIAYNTFMHNLCNRRVFKNCAKTMKQRRRVVHTLWNRMPDKQKVRWAYVRLKL